LYKKNSDFISPKKRSKEILNRVNEGLRDLSISRTGFKWGISLPFDKKHVAYVWFDALTNYYAATRRKGKEDFWPADVHLVGKDILWFHSVIWPAMLISTGIKLPKKVFAHGWLTFDKEKISKSRGKVINIDELVSIAGTDSARYFLLRAVPFGDDGDFSEKALISRHNNELADKLGNLVSRVSALIEKYGVEEFESKSKLPERFKKAVKRGEADLEVIPEHLGEDIDRRVHTLTIKNDEGTDGILLSKLKLFGEVTSLLVDTKIENFEFDKALNTIFTFIDYCNWYVQTKKPWVFIIGESRLGGSDRLATPEILLKNKKVLYELKESILKISELLWPFIPETSEKIKKQFSAKKIKKSEILFKKISA